MGLCNRNGQAAIGLSKYFKKVIASDASNNQIRYAFQRENIEYKVFQAENAELDNDSVDIVTVAQGLHWFDCDKFYSNVKRVGKNDGIIAVWSYDMHKINPQIDKITNRLDVDGEILVAIGTKKQSMLKKNIKQFLFHLRRFLFLNFRQRYIGICINFGII